MSVWKGECDSTVGLAASPWQHVSDESSGMSGGYSNGWDLNILTSRWEEPAVCLHRRRDYCRLTNVWHLWSSNVSIFSYQWIKTIESDGFNVLYWCLYLFLFVCVFFYKNKQKYSRLIRKKLICSSSLSFGRNITEIWVWCWMMKEWLGVPVHPRSVRLGGDHGSVLASQVLPQQPGAQECGEKKEFDISQV